MRNIGIAIIVSFLAASAPSQNIRSAVSVTGVDTATCTVADPCRTFGIAISRTNIGGEVIVLSSGGYGPFTVDKSISIIAPASNHAAVAPTSGNAITVNVDNAVVVLRGLTLSGSYGGLNGINFIGQTAAPSETRLYVENFVISGFGNNGVSFTRNGTLFVKQTIVRECGQHGIFIDGSPGAPSWGTIDQAFLEANKNGLVVDNAAVVARNSVATRNIDFVDFIEGMGFWARAAVAGTNGSLTADLCQATHNGEGFRAGNGAGTARLAVTNSVASDNFLGISTYPNGTVRVSNNTVTKNNVGLAYSFGTVESRGNNTVRGNNVDTSGTNPIFVFGGE